MTTSESRLWISNSSYVYCSFLFFKPVPYRLLSIFSCFFCQYSCSVSTFGSLLTSSPSSFLFDYYKLERNSGVIVLIVEFLAPFLFEFKHSIHLVLFFCSLGLSQVLESLKSPVPFPGFWPDCEAPLRQPFKLVEFF